MNQLDSGMHLYQELVQVTVDILFEGRKQDGQLPTDPLVLYKTAENRYTVVAGNHRVAAWTK